MRNSHKSKTPRSIIAKIVSISIFLTFFTAVGQESATTDITTRFGKVYKNAKITRSEPDGLVIMHSGGIATVKFSDLSEELQKKYGYDPEKAEEYTQQRMAAQKQRAQAMIDAKEKETERFRKMAEKEAAKSDPANFRYISQADIKNAWRRVYSNPPRGMSKMSREYNTAVKSHESMLAKLNNGKLDSAATIEALEYNINLASQKKDERARQGYQVQLAQFREHLAREREADQLDALTTQLQLLRSDIQHLDMGFRWDW